MNNARRAAVGLIITSCCGFAGCIRDFGTGGTGELVVPKRQLRVIDPLAFEPAPLPATTAPAPTTGPATLPTTLPATQPAPGQVTLSIAEVRQLALQNNLDLRVELLSPTIAREALGAEQAAYDAIFTTGGSFATSDTPTATQLEGSQSKSFAVQPGLRLPLRTGGVVDLSVPVDRFETNNEFATLNPAYETDAAASISHPLLRGAGLDVNAQQIRVAFYQYQQAQVQTKLQVIGVLVEADRAYWRLFAARQALAVRRQEYELAVAQLDRARRFVKAGEQAEPELVRAQSGAADRVEAVIIAENEVRDAERILKRILNRPDVPDNSPTVVVPATEPVPVPYVLDPERLAALAMDKRMELLEAELQLAREASDVRFARNGLLPLLSLQYTYNVNGLGSSLGDSFDLTRERDFEDHRVGLNLELPIGNRAARARLRQALATRMQALATRDQRVSQIRLEVFEAVDQLDANWQRILAARQRVVLAARLLDVEVRQFELGLRTSTEVLDAQTNLANARLSEIDALVEYQLAQIDIAFATGTVLGADRVVWDPIPVKGE